MYNRHLFASILAMNTSGLNGSFLTEFFLLLSKYHTPVNPSITESGTDAPEAIKNRSEVRTKLRQLETDYNREDSAVYVWEALDLAERNGINRPGWVEDYLVRAAARLMQILNDVAAGKGIGRQADEVGRALGFGPGGGCRFKHAARLERDRTIYHSVEKKLGAGIKLDAARFEVAKDMNLSYATNERSHKRISEHDG